MGEEEIYCKLREQKGSIVAGYQAALIAVRL